MSDKLFLEINEWLKQHRQGLASDLVGEKLVIVNSRLYRANVPIIFALVESYNVNSEIQPLIDLADEMKVNPLESLWLLHVPGLSPAQAVSINPESFYLAEFEYREQGFYWDFTRVTRRIAEALTGKI